MGVILFVLVGLNNNLTAFDNIWLVLHYEFEENIHFCFIITNFSSEHKNLGILTKNVKHIFIWNKKLTKNNSSFWNSAKKSWCICYRWVILRNFHCPSKSKYWDWLNNTFMKLGNFYKTSNFQKLFIKGSFFE